MTRFAEALDSALARMSGVEVAETIGALSYRQRLRLGAALKGAQEATERAARRAEAGRLGGLKSQALRTEAGTQRDHQRRAAAARWGSP